MKGTTHFAFGLGLGLVLGNMFEAPYDISSTSFLAISLGALAPDIDSEGLIAHPGKLFAVKNKNMRNMLNSFGSGVSNVISSFASHRGFFHWPIIAIIFISIGMYANSPFSFYFGVGYLSHCFLDSLNKQGIPILAPFNLKKYHIASIKYGGFLEHLLLALFALFILFYMKNDLMNYFSSAHS